MKHDSLAHYLATALPRDGFAGLADDDAECCCQVAEIFMPFPRDCPGPDCVPYRAAPKKQNRKK